MKDTTLKYKTTWPNLYERVTEGSKFINKLTLDKPKPERYLDARVDHSFALQFLMNVIIPFESLKQMDEALFETKALAHYKLNLRNHPYISVPMTELICQTLLNNLAEVKSLIIERLEKEKNMDFTGVDFSSIPNIEVLYKNLWHVKDLEVLIKKVNK